MDAENKRAGVGGRAVIAEEPPDPGSGVPEIILAVKDAIEQDAENTFAGYPYSSADAVYAAVRVAIAEQGLAPWMQEIEKEFREGKNDRGKRVLWGEFCFEIALTPGGRRPEEGQGERITIISPITGPQSMAAIRTYALKYWLRGKLLLETGEGDLDHDGRGTPPADGEPLRRRRRRRDDDGGDVPGPEDDGIGHWELDTETLEYRKVGEFPDEISGHRDLLRSLRSLYWQDDDELFIAVLEKNIDLYKALPPLGQKVISDYCAEIDERAGVGSPDNDPDDDGEDEE